MRNITGILHEGQYTFIIISRWILLGMRNVSDKNCRENEDKNFMFNKCSKIVPFIR